MTPSIPPRAVQKNPAAVLRESRNRPVAVLNHNHPVAVLNHNHPAFYMIEPQLFQAMMEELADNELYRKAAARLADNSPSI